MPELTVLLPVYNGMPYLVKAVESILEQSLKDFDFLIINDGSTDGSKEYLDQLDDNRIKVFHNPNLGLGATLNIGIELCNTEFLARMDADDISLPTRLEAQLDYLRNHNEVGLLGTQIEYFGESGRKGFSPPLPREHQVIYANLLRGHHAICHPTIMCRTSILREIGGYHTDGIGEDLDMFLRMGEASKIANLEKILFLYRAHFANINVKQQAEVRWQYAYTIHCARQRAIGHPESSFVEFAANLQYRSFWHHIAEKLDVYALTQYRKALPDILGYHRFSGYARLGWAALCSPRWTLARICRAIRNLRKS